MAPLSGRVPLVRPWAPYPVRVPLNFLTLFFSRKACAPLDPLAPASVHRPPTSDPSMFCLHPTSIPPFPSLKLLSVRVHRQSQQQAPPATHHVISPSQNHHLSSHFPLPPRSLPHPPLHWHHREPSRSWPSCAPQARGLVMHEWCVTKSMRSSCCLDVGTKISCRGFRKHLHFHSN